MKHSLPEIPVKRLDAVSLDKVADREIIKRRKKGLRFFLNDKKYLQGGFLYHLSTCNLQSQGILKNNITAPISKTLRPIMPDGVGPSRLLLVDNDIQAPASPIISTAP